MSQDKKSSLKFVPKHFLRCHSKPKDDDTNVTVKLWQCCFEPTASGEPAKIVATCGGNTVCCIDLSTGQVEKKYYSSHSGENFMALAWSIVNGHKILAAAGSVQTINFIHYEEGFCFLDHKFDKSKYAITSLIFHPSQGDVLYCSCNGRGNRRIIVSRLCGFEEPDFLASLQHLHEYRVECDVFSLILCETREILLGTSDFGIYCWNSNPQTLLKENEKSNKLLQFSGSPLIPTESPSLVDSAELLEHGLVASKCTARGVIDIWSLDDEKKIGYGESVTITPLYRLKWSNNDNYFMYIGYDKESKLLSCGDDRGAIWLYDLTEIVSEKPSEKSDTINPHSILQWPNVEDPYSSRKGKLSLDEKNIVINKTIINYNAQHIVAVTNSNMVCIWEKSVK